MTDKAPVTVNILGTEYSVTRETSAENPKLKGGFDGYCDDTVKKIVVNAEEESTGTDKENLHEYYKEVIRHEIVHAFLSESGLSASAGWPVNEEIVDWIALQGLKLYKAWQEAGAT